METAELVAELERRGHSVMRCQRPLEDGLCGKPSTGKATLMEGKTPLRQIDACDECQAELHRQKLRVKYGCCATLIPDNERIMAERYRMAVDGTPKEEIDAWLLETTGHTAEEWDRIEQYVHAGSKLTIWLVWGTDKGRFWRHTENRMLVLARSRPEAKKVWRQHLYDRKIRDIPNDCEAVIASHGDKLEPMVISTSVEWELESKLGLHDV